MLEVADRRASPAAGRAGLLLAAHARPDAGDELLGLERLDDVVVGAGLEPDDDVDGVALGGEHHDRHAGLGADLLAHVDAVAAGQHQVEQHDVGPVVAERPEGLVAARRRSGSRSPPGAARSRASRPAPRRRRRRARDRWSPGRSSARSWSPLCHQGRVRVDAAHGRTTPPRTRGPRWRRRVLAAVSPRPSASGGSTGCAQYR